VGELNRDVIDKNIEKDKQIVIIIKKHKRSKK
jgi:hypothetical protein